MFLQQEVWAYFTNSICDPVAFVNKKEGSSLSSFSRVVVFTILGVGHFDRNPVMFAVQVSRPKEITCGFNSLANLKSYKNEELQGFNKVTAVVYSFILT